MRGTYSLEIYKGKNGKLRDPAPRCHRVTRQAGHQKVTMKCLYEFAVTVLSTLPRDTRQFTVGFSKNRDIVALIHKNPSYVDCTRYSCNITDLHKSTIDGQKLKPTMASAASPKAANNKILESPPSLAHVSSSYACAQDEYFKRPHMTSIDGDEWLDSGWILVGFSIGGCLTCN
jgi:hypothetical protein